MRGRVPAGTLFCEVLHVARVWPTGFRRQSRKRHGFEPHSSHNFVSGWPNDESKKKLRSPGIEPGSITWQATIITTRPRTLISVVQILDTSRTHSSPSQKGKQARRRWIRTTGTLIPHGFEVQALNPQSSSTQNLPDVRTNSRPLDYETNALPTEPIQQLLVAMSLLSAPDADKLCTYIVRVV